MPYWPHCRAADLASARIPSTAVAYGTSASLPVIAMVGVDHDDAAAAHRRRRRCAACSVNNASRNTPFTALVPRVRVGIGEGLRDERGARKARVHDCIDAIRAARQAANSAAPLAGCVARLRPPEPRLPDSASAAARSRPDTRRGAGDQHRLARRAVLEHRGMVAMVLCSTSGSDSATRPSSSPARAVAASAPQCAGCSARRAQ